MGTLSILERPVYGLSQAADLLGLRTAKVRSWLDGYSRRGTSYPPVIRPEPSGSDLVTWGEYVELGYLREYRHAGVSLQSLRPVIASLRERYGTPYPLAHAQPFVVDQQLVMDLQEEFELPSQVLMVVRTGQGVLELAPGASAFYRKVEFDPAAVAERLLPAGKGSPVRIDPQVSFGMPAVAGIATERLFEVWEAEGQDFAWVARSYDLDEPLVRAAVAFEEQQRSIA